MTASLLAILTCLAVMASSAFALFHTEVSSASNTLQSAHYTVQVDEAPTGTYTCTLTTNDEHTFTIKASGSASKGYCIIKVGDDPYYTPLIDKDDADGITVTIQAAQGTTITFTPVWGTPPAEGPFVSSIYSLRNPEYVIVHSTTPHATYTVEATATLADIAEHYGVPVEDIVTYNGTAALTVGENVLIPNPATSVPYAVPYATYEVEATAKLEAIAEHYGVSATDILAFNGTDAITTGMELRIPYPKAGVQPYQAPVETESVEPETTKEPETTTGSAPTEENTNP